MLNYEFRPIDVWPGEKTSQHALKRSLFSASWSKTLDLLERELGYLKAKNIVIQVAVGLHQIRNDGMLYASARPDWPGIILSFDSKIGPLSYPCDKFNDWQANVRAVALSLEALRSVDRYGVTRRAEQYKGWARLPGPQEVTLGQVDAAKVLCEAAGVPLARFTSRDEMEAIYRRAVSATHPDTGGNAELFKKVQAAKEILDKVPA